MKIVLTIAGLDPSGGAGILLDARVLGEHEVFAAGVVSSLTEQDSTGVVAVQPVPPELVERQIRRVIADLPVAAIKVGMLGGSAVAQAVARALDSTPAPVVVDPVLRSSGGQSLIDDPAALDLLLHRATLVTPNLDEAQVLTGIDVPDRGAMARAAIMLLERGPHAVLVKGGHLQGDPVDLFYDGESTIEFPGSRISGTRVHGTGCALSSSIAAWLAHGKDLPAACERAQEYVRAKITSALKLGRGDRFMI